MPPALFSKSLEAALSAAALLAEVYDGGQTALTADQIAARQQLPRPFVSKLLTALSQSGIVGAKRGRGGGFTLARPPAQVTLLDLAVAIGHRTKIQCCPFGPDFGEGRPRGHCPLHAKVCELRERIDGFLGASTLAGFAASPRAPSAAVKAGRRRSSRR